MYGFSKVGTRQLMRWKECHLFILFDRVTYHSGAGVFGHRPRTEIDCETPQELLVKRYENCRAQQLVDAYRTHGHLTATIDNVEYKAIDRLVPLSPKFSSDDGIHEELRELFKNSRETYSDFSIFSNKPSICIQKVAFGEMELVRKTTDGHPKIQVFHGRRLVPLSPKSSSDDGIHEELRELFKNSRETYSDFSIFGNKLSICIQKVAFGEMELVQKTTDGHPKIQVFHGRRLVPLSPKSSSDDGIHEELRELFKNSRETYSDFSIFGNKPSICIQKVAFGEMELVQKTKGWSSKNGRRNVKVLQPGRYGLSAQEQVDAGLLYGGGGKQPVSTLVDQLEQIYCGPISYEFSYLETEAEREWFARRVESGVDEVDKGRRLQIAKELLESQAWDKFLSVKYPTVKRYCAEGSESLLTFYSTLFGLTTSESVEQVIVSMAHRAKLNALTGLLRCPPVRIFHKINGQPEFLEETGAFCDTVMHFNNSEDIVVNGKSVRFSMINNPSHLEAANPVSMGKVRSKQMRLKEGDYSSDGSSKMGDKVMNVQIHGDAAFAGQGINQEGLMLSRAPHFDIGGSIHVVVNNQVGFTLPAHRGRSCRYVTDLAKAIAVPVIHVNGDYPELVQKATNIAFEYQRKFRKDVFLDYNCFRRHGHNELDDPTFTNPLLYKLIHSRKTIPDLYAEKLVSEGVITKAEIQNIGTEYTKYLQEQYEAAKTYIPEVTYYKEQWSGMGSAPHAVETWNTGVDTNLLQTVGCASVHTPSDFNIHPHLVKTHVNSRIAKLTDGKALDWSTAEALAFGSLLMEGVNVRLSGEDVGRGTFSHRHAMLVDQHAEHIHIPLNHIHPDQKGFLEVANSILSEEAVLAFEYGMAFDSPANLCVWEAQFGDFFNGAQIIVDTFVASGESKWMRSNGLVMLLPHGFDGAASEHSSCKLERFLQQTDSREAAPDSEAVCLHIANPTTPAQYFHLMRRQMVRNYRKPLVVVAPKILLRLAEATSPLQDFAPGTHFHPVIGDPVADPLKVKRVILVSGKHYYELHKERVRARIEDVAVVRVESLSPFPLQALQTELNKYANARKFIWSQEEHRNMGAWFFVKPRFENLLGRKLVYSGRAEGPTTAVGASVLHRREVEHILREPLYNIK